MKRYLLMWGLAALLLLGWTALTSGERIGSGDKMPSIVEQTGQLAQEEIPQAQPLPETSNPAHPEGMLPSPVHVDDYTIPWQSINAGGDDMTSTNYRMLSSVGQSVIGYTGSANYQHGIGYWYGTEAGAGGDCICGDPVGDANCDAAMNPVDVVYMVNFVYKNLDARCYPAGWNCPYDLGDVNCDHGINPVDIVYYVNYVYKNLNAYCDPCVD